MKRLIALVVSGVALAACASPTEPTTVVTAKVDAARQSLVGATSTHHDQVSLRLAAN